LRGPGNDDIDGSIRRTFDLWNKENVKFVFEANVFNLENHVWFGTTSGNAASGATIGQSVTSSSTCNTLVTPNTGDCSLGVVAGQANLPRQWQFAGHIVF
jgi:hypothetical protein